VSEVVTASEGGGEPVCKPPHNSGGVEEVALQFDMGRRVGRSLAWGSPVD